MLLPLKFKIFKEKKKAAEMIVKYTHGNRTIVMRLSSIAILIYYLPKTIINKSINAF